MVRRALHIYRDILLLCMAAAVAGAVIGGLDAGFGRGLLWLTGLREAHPYRFLPFLPLAGGLMIFAFQTMGKNCIKGMGLVFQARFQEEGEIPLRLIPFAVLSTWATHLFGGSAGREGVAIQIGATVGHGVGRRLRIKGASKILLISGMAAGFAGLFQTPIAAVFFALEVLVAGALEYEALLPALTASLTAAGVSRMLGLERFYVPLDVTLKVDAPFLAKLILAGAAFGAAGALFARSLKKLKEILGKALKNPVHRIVAAGAAVAVLSMAAHAGRYSGLGTNLISMCFQGGEIHVYDWALKLLFTIVTLAAGFQGGEVTPLFAIGAGLGAALGAVLFLPTEFLAALGYAAVFSAATNTFLAPVLIGAEVFGFRHFPFFFAVCAIAHIVSGHQSIYGAQRRNQTVL